jgi:hypothetical protein
MSKSRVVSLIFPPAYGHCKFGASGFTRQTPTKLSCAGQSRIFGPNFVRLCPQGRADNLSDFLALFSLLWTRRKLFHLNVLAAPSASGKHVFVATSSGDTPSGQK